MEIKGIAIGIRFDEREQKIIRQAIYSSSAESPRENIDKIPEKYYPEGIDFLIEVLSDMKYNGPSFPETMTEEGQDIQKELINIKKGTVSN